MPTHRCVRLGLQKMQVNRCGSPVSAAPPRSAPARSLLDPLFLLGAVCLARTQARARTHFQSPSVHPPQPPRSSRPGAASVFRPLASPCRPAPAPFVRRPVTMHHAPPTGAARGGRRSRPHTMKRFIICQGHFSISLGGGTGWLQLSCTTAVFNLVQ